MNEDIIKWEDLPIEKIIGKRILIPVDKINPDPKNLRDIFDQEEIMALGENIKKIGQMDDIKIFPRVDQIGIWRGEFDLHDGERRWRAAKATGIPYLRGLVEEKPTKDELSFKKISRVMQTKNLKPDEKVRALEKTFNDLGILDKPDEWEKYRDRLGAGKEKFSELVRVIKLTPNLRDLMSSGTMSYTIAQAVGRLPRSRQEDAARFILTNKLYGRYIVTEFIPYLLKHPETSYAQAFEHTKVGGWRGYTKSPSKPEMKTDYEKVIDEFLTSCVKWERAWEKFVASGIIKEIKNKTLAPYRLKDELSRVNELAENLLFELFTAGSGVVSLSSEQIKLLNHKEALKKYKKNGSKKID